MLTENNMPPEGQAVKSSPQGAFSPNTPMKRGRRSPAKTKSTPTAPAQEAGDGKVVDLDQVRMAKIDGAVDMHRALPNGAIKPPALECLFSESLCRGYYGLGMWAAHESDATDTVIHKWTGTYWQAKNTAGGVREAFRWLKRKAPHAAKAKTAEQCWHAVCVDMPDRNPLPQIDKRRAIVPCADTYIEVLPVGFQALSPDPAMGMVHAIKIASTAVPGRPYRPQKLPEGSRFYKFLAHALPNPAVRALVQEHCGMTLLPGNYSQAAWWYGEAGSGKSTLAELVEAMHRQSVRLNLETLGDRFSLEPLIGASLILVDEVECEKWHEGRFKSLVSGNGVGIDRKNEKALASYHSRAKWLITSNNPPFVRDKSNGVWRRLSVVEWRHSVPEGKRIDDFHLVLLEEEGKLILDWMLEGAQRIVERGRLLADHELPEEARQAKQNARNNSDSVRAWADEMRVSRHTGSWMPLSKVYDEFKTWCIVQGFEANEILTSRQFWRGMSAAGLVQSSRKSNRNIGGKQTDCYEISILGRASDDASQWASVARVVQDDNALTTEDALVEHYAKWAAEMVGVKHLDARRVLDRQRFLKALEVAGYIDTLNTVVERVDGREVRGYRLQIRGALPPPETADSRKGQDAFAMLDKEH